MQAGPRQLPRAILVARQILDRASARSNAPERHLNQPVAEKVLAGFDPIGAPVIAGRIAGMQQGRKSDVHGGGFAKQLRRPIPQNIP